MRRLMCDDVMRQAGEHRCARRVLAVLRLGREVAEQQRLLLRAVVGVLLAQRVRIDAQARNIVFGEPCGLFLCRCDDQSAFRPSARSK